MAVKATSHLCVKRKRPLIITYSLYSENIMYYYFYLNTLGKKNKGAHAENLALSQLGPLKVSLKREGNSDAYDCQ